MTQLRGEVEHVRGVVLSRLTAGSSRAAAEAFQKALQLSAASGAQDLYARVSQSAGDFHRRAGRHRQAERLFRASVEQKRRAGDLAGLAVTYGGLARLARAEGDADQAIAWFRADLTVARSIGDRRGVGVAGNELGELLEERYLRTKDPESRSEAESAYADAQRAAKRSQNALDLALARYYRGRFLARAMGERDAGIELLKASCNALRKLGNQRLLANAEATLAELRP